MFFIGKSKTCAIFYIATTTLVALLPVIVGCSVAGGVLLLVIIILVVILLLRQRRDKPSLREYQVPFVCQVIMLRMGEKASRSAFKG